ncbi:MAG: hypothetical protein LJF06_07395 [Gemmatimonadetes bacterium]|nr:hypothetical protein [Gemmatimonadota bacterium]
MRFTDSRSRGTRIGLVLAAVAALVASACSLSTGPGSMPTVAHIVVQGTAPGSLQLILSTDFYEVKDQNGVISEVYNSQDTTDITLPYDNRVQLTSLGSISVKVRNTSATAASVHLQVGLDNGQGFDHTASIANGQEMSYIYVYTAPTFH